MNKSDARADARSRLLSIPEAERRRASERIAGSVWAVPEIAAARTLLLYASTPEEVRTDEIAREAVRRGIVITYPRCVPATREMTLHPLGDHSELQDGGRYGIREPDAACPRLSPEEIDAVLVPGLAWDREGTRLGRGAGYYDRLFARQDWRAFRCGIFFAAQELPRLPRDPWDRPLQGVVTEREIVRFVPAISGG